MVDGAIELLAGHLIGDRRIWQSWLLRRQAGAAAPFTVVELSGVTLAPSGCTCRPTIGGAAGPTPGKAPTTGVAPLAATSSASLTISSAALETPAMRALVPPARAIRAIGALVGAFWLCHAHLS
ncbi:MAG: hypothetical protein Q4G67_15110 [Actinomycetia bacterium]|nr:hypothetical protein [Actinomycetes bacterium]